MNLRCIIPKQVNGNLRCFIPKQVNMNIRCMEMYGGAARAAQRADKHRLIDYVTNFELRRL